MPTIDDDVDDVEGGAQGEVTSSDMTVSGESREGGVEMNGAMGTKRTTRMNDELDLLRRMSSQN